MQFQCRELTCCMASFAFFGVLMPFCPGRFLSTSLRAISFVGNDSSPGNTHPFPVGIIDVTLLQGTFNFCLIVFRQLLVAIDIVELVLCELVPPFIQLQRSDTPPIKISLRSEFASAIHLPVFIMPTLVLIYLNQVAKAQFAFSDLDGCILAFSVSADSACVWTDFCNSLLEHRNCLTSK